MSLTQFWEWIQDSANLKVNGKSPSVSAFKSLRGKTVCARVSYGGDVFRVIARLDDKHALKTEVVCERTTSTDEEDLRSQLQTLLDNKMQSEKKRRSELLAII